MVMRAHHKHRATRPVGLGSRPLGALGAPYVRFYPLGLVLALSRQGLDELAEGVAEGGEIRVFPGWR